MKIRSVFLALFLSIISSHNYVNAYNEICYDDPVYYVEPSCCIPACAWALHIQSGISPTWYEHTIDNLFGAAGVNESFGKRHFNDMFQIPVTIGCGISCRCSLCFETFVEGNYTYAHGKFFSRLNSPISEQFSDLKQIEAWFGGRYFAIFKCWEGFIGLKGGYMHRNAVSNFLTAVTSSPAATRYFKQTNTFGIGAQIGLGYRGVNWEVGLVAEGIVAGPFRPALNELADPSTGAVLNLHTTDPGLLFSIPVKVELKYYWQNKKVDCM